MSENRLSNLVKDLIKAKQQALLIEVLQSDLATWSNQSPNAFRTVCDASAKVFDVGVKGGKTNVLVVGEAESQAPTSIFSALLNSLDEEFDDLHKREVLEKLTGFGLSQALGGGLGDTVGESLNIGAEKMMDYLVEWTGSASDFMASAFETGIETVAEQSGDLLETVGESGAEAVTGYFSSDNEMYLSRPARKRMKELAPRLSAQATSHEVLQLALQMLMVTIEGAPKVIVVKDPLQLDDASLALLAMLVSLEKDLRQVNHTDDPEQSRVQTAGISVVLTFTGPQPHDTVEDKATEEKLRAISRLRMMASRYSLLERLDSDIPVPAVRASTFVGREAELNSLWQDWSAICKEPDSAGTQTWALIKGEPGTGKTALANRFIQQVRSDTSNPARLSIPTLRMLNQTGHSAQATGLASLKNSIVDELRRLNLIYEENVGWFARTGREIRAGAETLANDARSDDPEAKKRVRAKLGRMISRLVGVDSAIEVARSAKAWNKQDDMLSLRQEDFGQSSQANHKKEQYELLRLALGEIRQLALKCTPVIEGEPAERSLPLLLLIDDLQWMDDFTAEFLMNEWPANLPVYVIATARGSDSFTAAMESGTHAAMNRHRNQLFVELGLIDAAPPRSHPQSGEKAEKNKDKVKEEPKTVLSLTSHLDLKGMDQPMLANLIKLTYVGITRERADQFAGGVIRNLAGENSASDVITLFAIETLNVISDSQFYKRNPELPRLVEPLGADRYRFKAPASIGLTKSLDSVFRKLTDTYQASYLVESQQSAGSARFNLASYAVLEERLHLIEQHFGNRGGTARYSLLFSALLGSPFQSGLVRHVLEDLQQMCPEEHSELAPFLRELQAQAQGSLEPAQYELLEQAYEIIRRLGQGTATNAKYTHQHGLLRHFLLGQLTQLLEKLYPDADTFDKSLNQLIVSLDNSGEAWFDIENGRGVHDVTGDVQLEQNLEKGLFQAFLNWYRHNLLQCKGYDIGEWSAAYVLSLSTLSDAYVNLGRLEEALKQTDEAYSIADQGYLICPQSWADHIAIIGRKRAIIHLKLSNSDDAMLESIWHLDNALESVSGYQMSSESSRKSNFELNRLLAEINRRIGADSAVDHYEKAVNASEEGFSLNPKHWKQEYVESLCDLAQSYAEFNRPDEALMINEKAFSICRGVSQKLSGAWAKTYANCLYSFAVTHYKSGRLRSALESNDKALAIMKDGYVASPARWIEMYVIALSHLAKIYFELGHWKDELAVYQEMLSVYRTGYELGNKRWFEDYTKHISRLAVKYDELQQPEKAVALFEEELLVRRGAYDFDLGLGARDYAVSLNQMAIHHSGFGRVGHAMLLFEEAVSISREGYKSNRPRWARDYATILNNLAMNFDELGRMEDARSLKEELLSVRREGYESDRQHWEESYAISLNNLAVIYDNLGRTEEALPMYEQAMSIRREGYESHPERWAEDCAVSLSNLARTREETRELLRALDLWQEAKALSDEKSPLPTEARLSLHAESLIMSSRLLRMLERYPEAFSELDALEVVHMEMDAAEHPERLYYRAWSLIVRATTLVEAGDVSAAKILLPEAKKLIRDHRFEDLEEVLDLTREEIENA